MHNLLVSSLGLESFLELCLSLTFKLNSLSNKRGSFLLCIGDNRGLVGISLSNHFCSLGRSFFLNLGFNQSCLSHNLIVLEISLSINLRDKSLCLGLPLSSYSRSLSLDALNLLGLLHLGQVGLLLGIFSLFFLNLLSLNNFFHIILNSLFEGELLALKCILELENGFILHRHGNIFVQDH